MKTSAIDNAVENAKDNLEYAMKNFARDAERLAEQLTKIAANAKARAESVRDDSVKAYSVDAHLNPASMTGLVADAAKVNQLEETLRTLLFVAAKLAKDNN